MARQLKSGERRGEVTGIDFERTLPYAFAAERYLAAGHLPIPVRGKRSPVPGFTGHDGKLVTTEDVERWSNGPEAGWNIAIRMLTTQVGIDIDGYEPKNGSAVYEKLAEELGQLPSTWRSTSRIDDTVSGIRMFRIPGGDVGDLDPDIQVIKHTWRYAVVWPSWHPETSNMYRWFRPDGEITDEIPLADEIPSLPEIWLERCRAAKGHANGNGHRKYDDSDRISSYTNPDIPWLKEHGIPADEPHDDTLRDVCWDMHNLGHTKTEIWQTWWSIVRLTPPKKDSNGRDMRPFSTDDFDRHYGGAVKNAASPVTSSQRGWIENIARSPAEQTAPEVVQIPVQEDIRPDQTVIQVEQTDEQPDEQPAGADPDAVFRDMLKDPKYARRALGIGFDSWFRKQMRGQEEDVTSWGEPVDLGELLGDTDAEAPTEPDRLARKDGICIGYQGMVHWLWGRPQNGKTVLGLLWVAQEVKSRRHVLWIDLEHQKRLHAEKLLTLMNCEREQLREFFHLIEPDGPFTDMAREVLLKIVDEYSVSLVVIDAFNDLIVLQGSDANDVEATGQLERSLIQPCIGKGAAVLVIDHMKKDTESHGWPINSSHKKAVADVGWEIEAEVPFTRDNAGFAQITSYKDRPGNYQEASIIACLCVGFGAATLQKEPGLGDLSAQAQAAGLNTQDEQHAARRQCIILHVRNNQGSQTVSTAARQLAEQYHTADSRDGFSYSQFYRDLSELVKSKDGEVQLVPTNPDDQNSRTLLWLRS